MTAPTRSAHREHGDKTVSVSDQYDDWTYRWLRLSVPSPELRPSLRAAGVRNDIDE